MPSIILSKRINSQPQGYVELSPNYKNSLFLFLGRSIYDIEIARSSSFSSGSFPTAAIRKHGKTLKYGGSYPTYLQFSKGIGVPTSFTVMVWVQPAAVQAGYARIIETEYSVGFLLGVSSDGLKYNFIMSGNTDSCVGGDLVIGRRDFVVATFTSGMRRLYVNGNLVANSASGGINSNYGHMPPVIGGASGNPNGWNWNGDIDTVGIWNKAFSEGEIKSIYQDPWKILNPQKRKISSISASGPSYFDTDFSGYGSSVFSGERTNVFSMYYNFNGSSLLTPENVKIDGRNIQSEGSSLATVNDSALVGTDTTIAGTSTSNIQSQKIHSVNYTSNGTCIVTYKIGADQTTSIFAQDDFNGTTGEIVETYNPDWIRSIFTPPSQSLIITDEQRTIIGAAGTAIYYHRNIPATADYDVSADIFIKSPVETIGIIGRGTNSAMDHYLAQFTSSFVKLFKIDNAVGTQLQFKPITLNVGQTYNLKLSMFGSSIKVYVDGVETLSAIDSSLTDKGYAGIRNYYENAVSYTTGMHVDNFLAVNTNTSNKNIISINVFPSGTSVDDPKIQSIISNNLSSSGSSNINTEQYSINNIELSSVGLTTEEFLDSIISTSKVSSEGLSLSNIYDVSINSSDTEITGVGNQILNDTIIKNNNFNLSGSSSQSINDTIIKNNEFESSGISNTDIKSAYIHLCELVSTASTVEDLISAITYNTEINSVGSCIVTFYEGAEGGTTFINVDMIISGSSITLPRIQKVFSTNTLANSISTVALQDNVISLSNVSSSVASSSVINTQKLLSADVSISGNSDASIITNIILNSRIISDGASDQLINSVSIQNTDIESVCSSITNFLDSFIQSTDFLSNGTCVVSIQQGQDGGKIIINVDFIMDGSSSINNNTGLTLNTNLQSQSYSEFISSFTKIDGQDFTASGSSIIDFIREYLILQTNRKYVSVAERRNYVSSVERRNYASKVKG